MEKVRTVSAPERGGRAKEHEIKEEADSAHLRDEWEALAYATGASFFQSPQWVAAWQQAYVPEAEVFFLTARDGEGSLVGLLPLAELSRALHRRLPLPLRYVGIAGAGKGAGDHLGPLSAHDAVAERLMSAAVAARPSRSVLLESVGPERPLRLDGALTKQAVCPSVDLTDVDRIKDLWKSKIRKNLRRNRRMADDAGLSLRWYAPGETPHKVIEDIGALHIARQQTLGRSGLFDKRRSKLLRALADARYRGNDGQWVAVMVDEEDKVRAGLVGFQYAGKFFEYKTGWDPDLHKLGLGKILKTDSVERAIDEGLKVYDFMRGSERYKYRLGGEDRVDTTALVPVGITGWLLRLRERFDKAEEQEGK